jgi:hypothetical protein
MTSGVMVNLNGEEIGPILCIYPIHAFEDWKVGHWLGMETGLGGCPEECYHSHNVVEY